MTTTTIRTNGYDELGTLGIGLVDALREVLTTGVRGVAHAIVRIVPVVSELLNLTENVSPICNVNADP
jgi:hypothetical protein